MSDLARDSDRHIEEARRVRDDNRAGGRHRREQSSAIGNESRKLRRRHRRRKLRNIVIALFAIWVATGIIGSIIEGIGLMGVVALVLASVVVIAVMGKFPRMKVPQRAELNNGHYLVGEAVFVGLEPAVRHMRELMDAAR